MSDVEEETYKSKDRGKKSSKSRKQSSKEFTKKDGPKSKYGTATYVRDVSNIPGLLYGFFLCFSFFLVFSYR